MGEPYRPIPYAEILAQNPDMDWEGMEAAKARLNAEQDAVDALRKLVELTQVQVAQSLGVPIVNVGDIERQADHYLSTLRRFVQAAGGNLELVIELPGRPALHLESLGDLFAEPDADNGDREVSRAA